MAFLCFRAQVLSEWRLLFNYTKLSSQSQSQLLYDWRFTASPSWYQAPWDPRPVFFFQLNTRCYSPYVTSSLTRGRICRLQLLLALASAVILGSDSRGTYDHTLLSHARDFPNLEGQAPVFISPLIRVSQLSPQALGSVFVSSYDS
jgi:hypothetical protein